MREGEVRAADPNWRASPSEREPIPSSPIQLEADLVDASLAPGIEASMNEADAPATSAADPAIKAKARQLLQTFT